LKEGKTGKGERSERKKLSRGGSKSGDVFEGQHRVERSGQSSGDTPREDDAAIGTAGIGATILIVRGGREETRKSPGV